MRFWYFVTWKQEGRTYSGRRDFASVDEARSAHARAVTFGWVSEGMSDATVSSLYAENSTGSREIAEGSRQ